jgi:predicted nucleic acid-binding protein
LYPAPLRDLLIQLATANLFRAKWTDQIHAEWIDGLLAKRRDLRREQLERTRDLMNRAVSDALVSGHDYLIPTIELPDPNDRHVVAAAIRAHADAIVTVNLRDFPIAAIARYNLEVIHPDDFISFQADLEESAVIIAAQTCRMRLKNPPKTPEEYLAILQQQELPKTVAILRRYATIL